MIGGDTHYNPGNTLNRGNNNRTGDAVPLINGRSTIRVNKWQIKMQSKQMKKEKKKRNYQREFAF